ncbi:MAG TPA: hypothetical protein VH877_03620 [Polyangia bacterium]|nr:hypothetical protein [Polyangia bacterium]
MTLMPYRELTPPPEKNRTIEYGPFRLAWVRLTVLAVLAVAIAGSLRLMLCVATLECSRGEGSCELRLTGLGTRIYRFGLSQFLGVEIMTSQLVGRYDHSRDSGKAFIPRLVLDTGPLTLFDVEETAATQLQKQVGHFFDDESQASLSLTLEPTQAGPVVQLILLCPLALFFLISGLRSGGGTLRLSIQGNLLTVQRRWLWGRGRVAEFAVDGIGGVEVERRGPRRRAKLLLLLKNGHEVSLMRRPLDATRPEEHERVAHELRVVLACPILPDVQQGAEPERPGNDAVLGGVIGGIGGFVLGFGMFQASDLLLNSVATDGKPERLLLVCLLVLGVIGGVLLGVRRTR